MPGVGGQELGLGSSTHPRRKGPRGATKPRFLVNRTWPSATPQSRSTKRRRTSSTCRPGHSRCLPEASPIRRMCKPVIQNGFSDHFPDHHDGHRGRLGRQPEQFWRDLWRWPVTSAAVWDAVVRQGMDFREHAGDRVEVSWRTPRYANHRARAAVSSLPRIGSPDVWVATIARVSVTQRMSRLPIFGRRRLES